MILRSKATPEWGLHDPEHVNVRRCALFALALYLWAKHDLNSGDLPVGLVDRAQLGDKPPSHCSNMFFSADNSGKQKSPHLVYCTPGFAPTSLTSNSEREFSL